MHASNTPVLEKGVFKCLSKIKETLTNLGHRKTKSGMSLILTEARPTR